MSMNLSKDLRSLMALTVLTSSLCVQLAAPSVSAAAPPKLTPLHAWWSPSKADNRTTSDPSWEGLPGETRAGGYGWFHLMGWIYHPDQPQPPGTAVLYSWYSLGRGDHLLSSDPSWASTTPGEVRDGYTFLRREGFIPTAMTETTSLPLRSWWSSTRADNYATTLPEWSGPIGAVRDGYVHYREEGFVFPPEVRADLKRFSMNSGLPTASGAPEVFRHQGRTRRCQAFAAVAALEAAYKRAYGGSFDFSEQFLGYVGKLNFLFKGPMANAELAENQVGLYDGGGGIGTLLAMETGLRVPREDAAMPFTNLYAPRLEDTLGRYPLLDGTDTQDLYNALNWGPVTVNRTSTITGLPRRMLERPEYFGAEEIVMLCNYGCGGVVTEEILERTLREGHELVLDREGWDHVVLVVGYDRSDPANKFFLVKDSAGHGGSDSEDGFERYSYDRVLNAGALSYIERVRTPGPWVELRSFGSWKLNYAGWRGELVINHQPGTATRLLEEFDGVRIHEARLGSFKDPTGAVFRVNGLLAGVLVQFYIDNATPNLPLDQKSGRVFRYYRSGGDNTLMAGFHTDLDGRSFAGYATKGDYLSGRPAAATGALRWVGVWDVRVDGRTDVLTVTSAGGSTLNLTMRRGGTTRAITGSFDAATSRLRYTDDTNYALQEINASGVAAGTSGALMGVVATRR